MHTPVQHRPVPANTAPSVLAASPNDRYALATAAGPQRDPLDCQLTCLWNVAATGSRHARSISSGVRVTEDAMTCAGTWDWPTTRAPVPSRPAATTKLMMFSEGYIVRSARVANSRRTSVQGHRATSPVRPLLGRKADTRHACGCSPMPTRAQVSLPSAFGRLLP